MAKLSFLPIVALALLSVNPSFATEATPSRLDSLPVDPTAWARTLKSRVQVVGHASTVDYAALRASPGDLDHYLAEIAAVTLAQFSALQESQRLAFLINAYNALTIRLVLDHFPVKSIKDIGGFFSSPWKLKFFNLLGEARSLDDLEHGLIRKDFKEPRIHFALVCASKGCPPLSNEPYVASKLESQLELAARNFLSDRKKNIFEPQRSELKLSSIFKWYGEDFVARFGSVRAFVAPRVGASSEEISKILSEDTKISFLDYDWTLNGI